MGRRTNDIFDGLELENNQEGTALEQVPAAIPKSMEEKELEKSFQLLEEVQTAIRKTKKNKEEAAEVVRQLWNAVNSIKSFSDEVSCLNSEVKKKLEGLNYKLSDESKKFISQQMSSLRESFLLDLQNELKQVKDDYIESLMLEGQESLTKIKDEIKREREGKITIGTMFLVYISLLFMASFAFMICGIANVATSPKEKKSLVIWFSICLLSPWVWQFFKYLWRKITD